MQHAKVYSMQRMAFSECKWLKIVFIFSPVADRYSIDGLKQYATFTISMKLDSSNVVDIYVDSVTQLPVIGKILYQSPLILTELFQHNLINVSYLTTCYLYQVMMTLHFLNDVANDAESIQKSKIKP